MEAVDPYIILSEIFCNKSKTVIENIIRIVQEDEQGSLLPADEKLEAMINLLSGNSELNNENAEYQDSEDNELLDEAAGINIDEIQSETSFTTTNTLKRLLEIFPNADPSYLEREAAKLASNSENLEDFIEKHLENDDYPTLDDYMKYSC